MDQSQVSKELKAVVNLAIKDVASLDKHIGFQGLSSIQSLLARLNRIKYLADELGALK